MATGLLARWVWRGAAALLCGVGAGCGGSSNSVQSPCVAVCQCVKSLGGNELECLSSCGNVASQPGATADDCRAALDSFGYPGCSEHCDAFVVGPSGTGGGGGGGEPASCSVSVATGSHTECDWALCGSSDPDVCCSEVTDYATREGLECGGGCVDPSSDVSHCGACGQACAAGEACIVGSCSPVPGSGGTSGGGTGGTSGAGPSGGGGTGGTAGTGGGPACQLTGSTCGSEDDCCAGLHCLGGYCDACSGDYPQYCPALGDVAASCWTSATVCSTVTSCAGTYLACSSAAQVVDCVTSTCAIPDPCSAFTGWGLACGANLAGGDPAVLYLCSEGATFASAPCPSGCHAAAPGEPDYCLGDDPCVSGVTGGLICGANLSPAADPYTLYECENQATVSTQLCATCQPMPPGEADLCLVEGPAP